MSFLEQNRNSTGTFLELSQRMSMKPYLPCITHWPCIKYVPCIKYGLCIKHGPCIKYVPCINYWPCIKYLPGITHWPCIKYVPCIKYGLCIKYVPCIKYGPSTKDVLKMLLIQKVYTLFQSCTVLIQKANIIEIFFKHTRIFHIRCFFL